MRKILPSPSANVNEKKLFTIDKLIPKKKDEQGGATSNGLKQCPEVALYNQRAKRVSRTLTLC